MGDQSGLMPHLASHNCFEMNLRRKKKKVHFTIFSFSLTAFDDELVSMADVSCYVEDPGFGYKDFARRGEDHLPTFRAQVSYMNNLLMENQNKKQSCLLE